MNDPAYQWRVVFLTALKDVDSENFSLRLMIADDAIFQRLFALEGTKGTGEERQSLENTMQDIRLLRAKSYHFRA